MFPPGASAAMRSAIVKLLVDGQYHEREEIIAATRDLLNQDDLAEVTRDLDYRMARRAAHQLSAQDWRHWVEAHPDSQHYGPTPRGLDLEWGHRQFVIHVLGRMTDSQRLDVLRASARGPSRTLYRKGGEAAAAPE